MASARYVQNDLDRTIKQSDTSTDLYLDRLIKQSDTFTDLYFELSPHQVKNGGGDNWASPACCAMVVLIILGIVLFSPQVHAIGVWISTWWLCNLYDGFQVRAKSG